MKCLWNMWILCNCVRGRTNEEIHESGSIFVANGTNFWDEKNDDDSIEIGQ